MAAWWPDSSTSGTAPPLPLGRPGVVRVFQQPGGEALLLGAVRRAHHAGQQPHAGIQQHQRRQLAAGQHVVADADLLGAARVEHALVDALVAAAQQHARRARPRARAPVLGQRPRRAATGRAAAARRRGADRRVEHVRPHHHAGAAAERRVVHACGAGRSRPRGCRARRATRRPALERPPGQRLARAARETSPETGCSTVARQLMPTPPRADRRSPPGLGAARSLRRHDHQPPGRDVHLRHAGAGERHQQRPPPPAISRLAPAP